MTTRVARRSDQRVRALSAVEDEIGRLMRRARRAVAERAALVHPDMHPASYLMLTLIADQGPIRGGEVGCQLQIDKAAVSRYAQHLLDLGLVERMPDPDDGRASLLSVSPEGRRRVDAIDDSRRATLDERLSGWSDTDLADLAEVLGRYNATLD
ncbi:MAG: MarR family transcriptional regulator [Aeromicrobium erythreum]